MQIKSSLFVGLTSTDFSSTLFHQKIPFDSQHDPYRTSSFTIDIFNSPVFMLNNSFPALLTLQFSFITLPVSASHNIPLHHFSHCFIGLLNGISLSTTTHCSILCYIALSSCTLLFPTLPSTPGVYMCIKYSELFIVPYDYVPYYLLIIP